MMKKLLDIIHSPYWDNRGKAFMGSKLPSGIKQLRGYLNESNRDKSIIEGFVQLEKRANIAESFAKLSELDAKISKIGTTHRRKK